MLDWVRWEESEMQLVMMRGVWYVVWMGCAVCDAKVRHDALREVGTR
jgi:hypothetical protein